MSGEETTSLVPHLFRTHIGTAYIQVRVHAWKRRVRLGTVVRARGSRLLDFSLHRPSKALIYVASLECHPEHSILVCMQSGEIHVWTGQLTAAPGSLQKLSDALSEDERFRADRFRFEEHRRHYVIGRGLLRFVLGCYLECSPKYITFRYGREGKPFLCDGLDSTLYFNVAHSKNWVLYALCRDCEVGADIEVVRKVPDMEAIATRFFAPRECAALLSLSPAEQSEAFLRCWTRKESFIKATGEGLSRRLDDFEVSLLPGEPARFINDRNDTTSSWSLLHLEPEGCIGAISAPLRDFLAKQWTFGDADECLEQLKQR
jgi:4'-phosphopantetheinyl transferase